MDIDEKDQIYNRALNAESAWSRELRRTFGRDACNARYEARGRGVPGGPLHKAYVEREAALVALHAYWHTRRVVTAAE